MMNGIKERNAQIFKFRYEEGLKPKEIGRIFGISRQRVEQIAPRNREIENANREIEDASSILLLQECIKLGLNNTQAAKKTGFYWNKINKLIPKYAFKARLQKFRNQIQRDGPDECWPWLGYKGPNGYGVFNFRDLMGNINRNTHRIAWILHNCRPIKPNMQVLHTCDNPLCCNPKHLYIGTPLDNMRDRDKRGRHHNSRLFTEQTVIKMRKLYGDGENIASIRRDVCPSVGYTVVFRAIHGHTYKNVVESIATSA